MTIVLRIADNSLLIPAAAGFFSLDASSGLSRAPADQNKKPMSRP